MSIATEIQRIQTAKADLKTAIEAKGVIVEETATIDTYASKVEEIQSGGLPKEYEWVNCITHPIINFDLVEGEDVIFTFPKANTFETKSSVKNNTLKHLTLNYNSPVTSFAGAFFNAAQLSNAGLHVLERITINANTSNCTNFNQFVRTMNNSLTTIDGTPFDFSSATNIGVFCNRCFLLSYIRIVPKTIKVSANFSGSLSWDYDSLDSIFEGLADLTGAESQTLTMSTHLQATIEANQDWLDKVTGRNWTLAFAK